MNIWTGLLLHISLKEYFVLRLVLLDWYHLIQRFLWFGVKRRLLYIIHSSTITFWILIDTLSRNISLSFYNLIMDKVRLVRFNQFNFSFALLIQCWNSLTLYIFRSYIIILWTRLFNFLVIFVHKTCLRLCVFWFVLRNLDFLILWMSPTSFTKLIRNLLFFLRYSTLSIFIIWALVYLNWQFFSRCTLRWLFLLVRYTCQYFRLRLR